MRSVHRCPCKINLFLNILGVRPDGFHELETVFHPVGIHDVLSAEPIASGIELKCSDPDLPTDERNLVVRAARRFFEISKISQGVRFRLEKNIPTEAGLGGGSSNAAHALLLLNELYDSPLSDSELNTSAALLGSDVNFFLQDQPALATGRGEKIAPTGEFKCLHGSWLLLFHPGFGISTSWAFQQLKRFPDVLRGVPGRAIEFVQTLKVCDPATAGKQLFNSLETPVLEKFPILELCLEFFRNHGAIGALMSGSGSTTYGIFASKAEAEAALEPFRKHFGSSGWSALAPLSSSDEPRQ